MVGMIPKHVPVSLTGFSVFHQSNVQTQRRRDAETQSRKEENLTRFVLLSVI